MSRIIYIPFDHLNAECGALRDADKATDLVVLVESQRMVHGRPWHRQRLHFLLSSARHFAAELQAAGWQVTYLKSATTVDGLQSVLDADPASELVCAEPSSFAMTEQLRALGATFVPNDFFLTPRPLFAQWAAAQKQFTMENFYRAQRRRLHILMDGDEPVGGAWNFDADNRLPPPKQHDWGPTLQWSFDNIDEQVVAELPDSAWGELDAKTWGTTRAEALTALEHFLEHHFQAFGPYEDAMPSQSWSGHHSLLSPYLNNGLLLASEVVDAALARFSTGDIPMSSCEGFIRQIIGWREYVNGMYWFLGQDYRDHNQLHASRPLLPLFHNPSTTQMNCVRTVVSDVHARGWTHHIPRLMVLSNLALLTAVNPQEFLGWMREVFVDAADWVMVPNVIGMGVHADGGQLMTKPYAAGGSYISKMGQFCRDCRYESKQRIGEDACPFTTLYWDFLARNADAFGSNHRMFQQFAGLRRLSDIEQVRLRAAEVLAGLEAGTV